jgi:acyl-CoA synthetase (AMP-forming)/AMP-acid ligase II
MPRGEVGELMIRGPIVMQGYCANDEATRETIEPDGWLHTGDLASMDEGDAAFIVDRKKDMINTAGFKVFPAEIERIVATHPSVAMVAVGRQPDELKGRSPRPTWSWSRARRPTPTASSRSAARSSPPTKFRAPCSSWPTSPRPRRARSCGAS